MVVVLDEGILQILMNAKFILNLKYIYVKLTDVSWCLLDGCRENAKIRKCSPGNHYLDDISIRCLDFQCLNLELSPTVSIVAEKCCCLVDM